MATLYHAPLTCSLAVRFAAAEAQVDLDVTLVNLRTRKTETGASLDDIHPLGQVAVLDLDDGTRLTETSAILAWVQSQSSNQSFRIAPSETAYFQMLRWLAFCATELHKGLFRVVFYPEATDDVKDRVRGLMPSRFALLDTHLKERDYLLGDRFSVADTYLAWFFVLSRHAQVDQANYPHLDAYRQRVLRREALAALILQDKKLNRDIGQNLFAD